MKTYNNYEIAKNLLANGNVRRVFDVLAYDFVGLGNEIEYNLTAEVIFETVQKFGESFVVDICEKVLKSNIRISDKQRWCVAFAFMKLTAEMIAEVEKLDNESVEEPEAEVAEEQTEVAETSTVEATDVEEMTEEVAEEASAIETTNEQAIDMVGYRDQRTTPACTPTTGANPRGVYATPTPAVTANHRCRRCFDPSTNRVRV